ncbi:MAG: ABC transporter ATP-binding protein [Ruminococcaceae bacterium]|nr:ABC transporter ATP-binding protein [Oscillospiraceae bacterium]
MIIQIRSAALTYQSADGEVEALRDISLHMAEGELCSLVGPSGCGKSTLLGAIAGLEKLDSGSILVDGQEVCGPSPRIGLMPQRDQLFEWKTIEDNVMLGLQVRRQDTPENRQRVMELLRRYGLAEFAHKRPGQLSGGMRQRCAMIRTLAVEPRILLLDEPFSALDYQTRLAVSADIHAILRREGQTALMVTHDIAEAVSMSDRVFVLSRRPAVVKTVHDLSPLRDLTPLQRRDHPSFHIHFNAIWKELDIHV